MRELLVIEAGEAPYRAAQALQRGVHARVLAGSLPSTLLLLEHPHVFTLGRRGRDSDILASERRMRELGAESVRCDRGGEATYHGPGQAVGYAIVNLRECGIGPVDYVRALERVIMATLDQLGIASTTDGMPTGVWVGAAKIAAIGVRVSRGVTTHGFALNVDPDLSYFNHIVPCGMPGVEVTSIARLGVTADITDVGAALAENLARELGCAIRGGDIREALASEGPDAAGRLAAPWRG